MEITKTKVAGKPSNIVGDSNSTLILRGSSLKYQFGNSFIDIIKNGKLNVSSEKLIKKVTSEDEITSNGLYIIEKSVYIKVDDVVIQLTGGSDTYLSFMVSQEDITSEQKQIALKNIGFYYDTIEQVQQANIKSGLVYILGDNKLYNIINGEIKEFVNPTSTSINTDSTIKNDLILSSNSLKVDNIEYIQFNSTNIALLKRVVIHQGIQSNNANANYGYRLYMQDGESILEVDNIIERNKKTDHYIHIPVYSLFNNSISISSKSEDYINITLQNTNNYSIGDTISIYDPSGEYLGDFPITEINGKDITIQSSQNISMNNCYTFLSSQPYIKIQNNTMLLSESGTNHTVLGQIDEQQLVSEHTNSSNSVGIYSDNFVGMNSKLYNPIFKGTDYPKYDNSLEIPNNINDGSYNQVIPNLEWVQALISQIIPKGTIVMWSGTNIPEGWAICNGENGTPNLIGKFIKASDTAGEFGGNNNITLSSDNLPSHQHTITNINTLESGDNSHSHTVPGQQLLGSILATNTILNWQSKSSNSEEQQDIQVLKGITLNELNEGDIYLDISQNQEEIEFEIQEQDSITSEETEDPHIHSIDSIITDDNDTQIKEINIQPEYYSLIFIIKQ